MRTAILFLLVFGVVACRETPSNPPPTSSTLTPATPTPRPESAPSSTAALPSAPGSGSAASNAVRTWSFDEAAGSPPAGFGFGRTGTGREGKWLVRAEPGAPSGANVLAQLDADPTDDRFPVAFANEPSLKDLDVRVRCKQISGKVDQACGLVFRFLDADNYYLTRANALEDNVRLYFVKGGRRQQIASYSGKVASGRWHELRAVARGDRFEVHFDGAKVLEQRDGTFPEAGKVGVWTKADSITYFDDLSVTPL